MTATIRTEDATIKRDVLRELEWDPRVDVSDVGVELHGGLVTLSGRVRNYAKKLAAQEAAHRVAGVRDVVNRIEVEVPHPDEPTDEDVARAIRHALIWDAHVPDEHIHTTVVNGWVTLTGAVELLAERDEATRAIERLAGVVGVSNDISVRERRVDEAWVRRSIEEALERLAHIEAEHLDISIDDGVAAVSGLVSSSSERRAALHAASCAPGVIAVEDRLIVGEQTP